MNHLFIVSGRSGSGKSICLKVLEDLNYYCIDNLPASLLPSLIEELHDSHSQIAVSIDARNATHQLQSLTHYLANLRNVTYEIIYLDAKTDVIIKRYTETRRKHPLIAHHPSLPDALQAEEALLAPILEMANKTIDTSHLSIQQLRHTLDEHFRASDQPNLSLSLVSFGFKFGVPLDADSIFDVRCLPNPYWENELSALTGQHPAVRQFLEQQPKTMAMLDDIISYLTNWLPHFAKVQRKYLTIAIGCTGGQHRSVYMTEKLAQQLRAQNYPVQVMHRELT